MPATERLTSTSTGGDGEQADTPERPRPAWMATGGDGEHADAPHSGASSSASRGMVEHMRALATDRPEILVGAAFVGGLILATILKRLGR